jgi:hypothetical protein
MSSSIDMQRDFAAEFIDWRQPISCVQSVMLVFPAQLCELLESNLLSCSTLLPYPALCVKVQYLQTVCGWDGMVGVESYWRPSSAGVYQCVSDQIQTLQNY